MRANALLLLSLKGERRSSRSLQAGNRGLRGPPPRGSGGATRIDFPLSQRPSRRRQRRKIIEARHFSAPPPALAAPLLGLCPLRSRGRHPESVALSFDAFAGRQTKGRAPGLRRTEEGGSWKSPLRSLVFLLPPKQSIAYHATSSSTPRPLASAASPPCLAMARVIRSLIVRAEKEHEELVNCTFFGALKNGSIFQKLVVVGRWLARARASIRNLALTPTFSSSKKTKTL